MDVFEQLLTSSSRGSVSPETLEYIGKKASTEFLEKKASLNDAIVRLASQHPELNNEHIHRIVEFANNNTFQHMFETNPDKNVHFPIADPGVVIRDLRDGGSPAHSGKVLHNKNDYSRAPIREEKDSSPSDMEGAGPESGFDQLFQRENSSGQFGQGEPIEKVASAGLDPNWEGSANPVNDIYAQHLTLERAHQELAAQHESADLAFQNAQADFYKLAKQHILSDGGSFRQVVEAFATVVGPVSQDDVAKLAHRLLEEGVTTTQLAAGKNKVAGALLNPAHPLVVAIAGMEKCASDRSEKHGALREIQHGLEKTSAFLKTAARK
jgi:hypothetical protein